MVELAEHKFQVGPIPSTVKQSKTNNKKCLETCQKDKKKSTEGAPFGQKGSILPATPGCLPLEIKCLTIQPRQGLNS